MAEECLCRCVRKPPFLVESWAEIRATVANCKNRCLNRVISGLVPRRSSRTLRAGCCGRRAHLHKCRLKKVRMALDIFENMENSYAGCAAGICATGGGHAGCGRTGIWPPRAGSSGSAGPAGRAPAAGDETRRRGTAPADIVLADCDFPPEVQPPSLEVAAAVTWRTPCRLEKMCAMVPNAE